MNTPPPSPDRPLSAEAIRALLLDVNPWLSCEDCFEQMDIYAEACLTGTTHHHPAMAAHLRGCPACAEEADTLIELLTG